MAGQLDRGVVVVLHSAGAGTDVPVLSAVVAQLLEAGAGVARLEQAYRVAGRRPPDPAPALDAVLGLALDRLALQRAAPVVLLGRSSGARVACRVGPGRQVAGVVSLGFPLVTSRGASRAAELLAAAQRVPLRLVQGERDAFGGPAELLRALDGHPVRSLQVLGIAGADHAMARLRSDPAGSAVPQAARAAAGAALELLGRPQAAEV